MGRQRGHKHHRGKRNDKAKGMHMSANAGPPQGKPHPSNWQKAKNEAKDAFNNAVWFFSDPNRTLALLTLILVVIGFYALYIQRDTEQRQLRAYVGVDTPNFSENDLTPPQTPLFHITARNAGQTPAYKATQRQGMVVEAVPLPEGFAYPFSEPNGTPTPTTILPGPLQGLEIDVVAKTPLTPSQIAVIGQASRIFVYGTIWYDDVFGAHHWTNWCFATSREVVAGGKIVVRHSTCAEHNDTDGG